MLELAIGIVIGWICGLIVGGYMILKEERGVE